MVKRIVVLLSFLVFVGIFLFGMQHWNAKIDAARKNGPTISVGNGSSDGSGSSSSEEGKKAVNVNRVELGKLVKNLPEDLADVFKNAFDNKEKVKMIILGSPSIGTGDLGWGSEVREKLEEIYGEGLIEITLFRHDGNSNELIEKNAANDVIKKEPDIVLFEGFRLEDNSAIIPVEKTHENLHTFMELVSKANPEVQFVLVPPNPIHKARNYPGEVEELKKFAANEKIEYLDHWEVWPDPNTDAILDYLTEESYPNEAGHELWANYIIDYFAADYEEVLK